MKILFVTNMYPNNDDPSSGAFVKQQAEALKKMGHQVDIMHILGYRSKLYYLKSAIEILIRTRKQDYDIVHAHYGLSGLPALFCWRTPVVITLHGSDALVGTIQPLISRFVCKFVSAIITVSIKISSVIPGEIIPCGVDFDVFRPYNRTVAREKLGLPKSQYIILFPFNPQRKIKRYDLANAVVNKLVSQGYDIMLLVVSGEENDRMPWYYSASDAMILCSDSEGSPTSVKEALACNLPVIATDVGDVRQIMEGIPGTKICKQDINDMSEGLKQVLTVKQEYKFDGRLYIHRYDQHVIAKSIVIVYEKVCQKRDSKRAKKSCISSN